MKIVYHTKSHIASYLLHWLISQVLVLGVTYKPDIDDLRESPALDIIKLLSKLGARVSYHDPFVTSLKAEGLDVAFAELTDESLRKADCVMIVTDHATYDWERIRASAHAFADYRNVLKRDRPKRDARPR